MVHLPRLPDWSAYTDKWWNEDQSGLGSFAPDWRSHFSDVLLALDLANNRIAAYPNSSTLNTTAMRSTSKGITVFQGKPLNMPGGLTINPLNGDLLVVNMNDNNLVELNLSKEKQSVYACSTTYL